MPQAVVGNYASWDPPLSYVSVAFLNYNLGVLSNTGQVGHIRRLNAWAPNPQPPPNPIRPFSLSTSLGVPRLLSPALT
jgi:hypothetical protein